MSKVVFHLVKLVTQNFKIEVRLTKKPMSAIEKQIQYFTNSINETFPNLGNYTNSNNVCDR
ncbi:hypothetical protein BV372_30200 [Nostoc sp. T09]|nr:hypothetical protein BV372_30200 [Nostoc sp. T09]